MRPVGPRILIAAQHRLVRESMHDALVALGSDVIAMVGDGWSAVAESRRLGPELVLLIEPVGGLATTETCRGIVEAAPRTAVAVVGPLADDSLLLAAIEAGASAYIDHDTSLDDLASDVHRCLAGELVVPPTALGMLLRGLVVRRREGTVALQRYLRLTPREREVLAMLTEGLNQDEVAERLVIAPETARTHIQSVLRKLEVHSRVEAVALASRHGWVEHPAVVR